MRHDKQTINITQCSRYISWRWWNLLHFTSECCSNKPDFIGAPWTMQCHLSQYQHVMDRHRETVQQYHALYICAMLTHDENETSYELRLYVSLNTKQVISETFPKPSSWLGMEKLNLTQQKHTFTNQKKCTTTQNKHNQNVGQCPT